MTRSRTLSRPVVFPLALLILLTPALGRAANSPPPAGVRLEYKRGPGVRQCPDVTELRSEVAAQLGRDPFTEAGTRRLVASVNRRKDGSFVATAELFDGDGATISALGELVGTDCHALFVLLAARLEVLVTVAIAPPQSAPPSVVTPPVLPFVKPPELPPPASPLRLRLGAGSGVEVGVGPSPSPTFALHVGLQAPILSVAFEARTDLPLTGAGEGGARIRAQVLSGSTLACFHGFKESIFFGCAMFTAGAFIGGDQRAAMGVGSAIYSAAGPRLGIAIPFAAGRFAVYFTGDVLATLHPIRVRFAEVPVWETGSVAAAFQAGFFAFR